MNRSGSRVVVTGLLLALGLAAVGCSSDDGKTFSETKPSKPGESSTAGTPSPPAAAAEHPIDFDAPSTPQAADKLAPVGDRTTQSLESVAARGQVVVAAGSDHSSNVFRPLFLSSDDGGVTWTRRQLDEQSVQRSSTSESVTALAAGPAGFVAIGGGLRRPVIWRSPDGHAWTRQTIDAKVFTANDTFTAITATPTGFAIVGHSELAAGGNLRPIVYWRSADGVSWKRSAGAAVGLKPTVNGELSLTDLVANGNTLVVSADLSTPNDAKQTDRLQYWYSTDAGKSFRSAAVRGEIATSYQAFNNALAVGDGKFVALVQGDGYDQGKSWDVVVVEGGAKGNSWQVAAKPRVLGSKSNESPRTLAKAGKNWVLASRITAATADIAVAAGPAWAKLADRSDAASQRTRGEQFVRDSVAVGSDVILVGSNDRSGATTPVVWRYHNNAVKPVALPAEASAGRASSVVDNLLVAGQDLIAVGSVSDAPTAWQQVGDKWQATTLPGRKTGVDADQYNAATTTDGRAVVIGEKSMAIGVRAAVWIRDRTGRWTEADSPVFGVNAKSQYGGPAPEAIAIGRGGWVVVGSRADGDGHVDAWTMHSTNGKTWTEGGGGKVMPPSPYLEVRRTQSGSLRSVRGDAAMNTVLAVGTRFIAGGDPGDGTPAVWLSKDGRSWGAPTRLPVPKGVNHAGVLALGRIGNTLVAVGDYYRTAAHANGGRISWTSRNGGLTWVANPITGPGHEYAGTLATVPNGLVALGYEGADDQFDRDAAAWFSRDGVSWRRMELPGDRLKGPGLQGLASAAVVDGRLLIVAYDMPPTGGGNYTMTIDLPK